MEVDLLLMTNRLAIVGVMTVALMWFAAALGKWKRGRAFRAMAWSSALGGAFPFLIFPIWTYVNAHLSLGAQVGFQGIVIVLWPSSIGLMGLEAPGTVVSKFLSVAVLVLMNAGLYGLLGLCIGLVWQKLARPTVFGKEEH